MARLGLAAQALGRIAWRGASKNRWLRAGLSAVEATIRSSSRVFHHLFLQMIGVVFCLFALGFAARMPRVYREHLTGHYGAERVWLLAALTILFAWFGLSSFWRAGRR